LILKHRTKESNADSPANDALGVRWKLHHARKCQSTTRKEMMMAAKKKAKKKAAKKKTAKKK
jgi:hypothetical protein